MASCLLLLLSGGCGDDSDDGASGPTLEELGAMLAGVLCTEAEACLGSDTIQQAFGAAGCEARTTASIDDGDFLYIQNAVDAGRVDYDASKVDGCIAALTGIGCGFETSRLLGVGECGEVFVGSVEEGGECTVDPECMGDTFCRLGNSCPGICTPLGGEGAGCDDDDECMEGLACSGDTGTCHEPVGAEDTCGGSSGAECRAGLTCAGDDEDTGATGTCKGRDEVFVGALGDDCDFDSATLCEDGLSCVLRVEGAMVRFACEEPVGPGDSCAFGIPAPCPEGQYCDADVQNMVFEGSCVALPDAGDACAETFGGACAEGLVCDVDGVCREVGRLGASCAGDDACASETCEDGACVRPPDCSSES